MNISENKGHILKGVVTISRENVETGEKEFLHQSTNIIPISGAQWLLMKAFGLYLDSKHDPSNPSLYEQLDRDTNLVIPDLNSDAGLNIGKPISEYTPMTSDIGVDHIVQGFMVGDGAAGEDGITTKNTDYSFIKLRNPIPFQQTNAEGLNADIAGKYLGISNLSQNNSNTPYSKSYFIKKFDERPHIYHSWWRENQDWDYIDPVTPDQLGPNVQTSVTSNEIETYVECKLSISNNDFQSYFAGTSATARINELGLVAFDVDAGARSVAEQCHDNMITQLINSVFDNNRTAEIVAEIPSLAGEILEVLQHIPMGNTSRSLDSFGNTNINNFMATLAQLAAETAETLTPEKFTDYQNEFAAVDPNNVPTNIGVEAFYNQNQTFIYATDKFKEYLSSSDFDSLTTDEAQRIKLFTYYTFNSIPLQSNWKILINYRLYAN